jgi:hydrogenase maturation protease
MSENLVERIARAVLYEGYLLYPYRPSVKNRHRWTFGGLYPETYCQAQKGSEASRFRVECLVSGSGRTRVAVQARFLHLQDRQIGQLASPIAAWPEAEPAWQPLAALQVGDRVYQSWQEAVERTVIVSACPVDDLTTAPHCQAFDFTASRNLEPLRDGDRNMIGVICRQQQSVRGAIELEADEVEPCLFKLTVEMRNTTPWQAGARADRDDAVLRSLASAHAVLRVTEGEFVSLLDPPESCRAHAAACRNVGVFPVLVGDKGTRTTMLASPIILYDYPQVAPESPGDLFDGTEIDEILTLRILTLTEDEKRAMSAVDERARALLQRTEALPPGDLRKMHGAIRSP